MTGRSFLERHLKDASKASARLLEGFWEVTGVRLPAACPATLWMSWKALGGPENALGGL